jgi:rsbT antagonist protein RsbS
MNGIPLIIINNIIIVSIQGDINDKTALTLQQSILEKIYTTGAKGVLLEISLLDIVDSFLGRIISETVKMVQLLGAKAVLSGMKPYIAITLVELGLDINGVDIAINSDVGIRLLEEHVKINEIETIRAEDLYEQEVN